MEQIRLNSETEALLEEVMWQMKGDMHNLVGQYNPTFTDKAERQIKEMLLTIQQAFHHQLQKAREGERERIIKLIDWRGKEFHSGSEVVAWIDEQLKTLNHSELDQAELEGGLVDK